MTDLDLKDLLGSDPSALEHPLPLTIFKNHLSKTGKSRTLSLRTFAEEVRGCVITEETAYLEPEQVTPQTYHPLVKLGTFKGNKRSTETLAQVAGVELDYDDGLVGPEVAEAAFRAAGVAALVYTSRSFVDEDGKRKWRALIPLRKPVTADEREGWTLAAANILDLPLDRASFTRAQIFFFAGIEGRERRVILIDGKFLDEVAKRVETPKRQSSAGTPEEEAESYREAMRTGVLQSSLKGIRIEDLSDQDFYGVWISIGMALHYASGAADQAFDLWCGVGARSAWHQSEIAGQDGKEASKRSKDRRIWDKFKLDKAEPVGLGTIFHYAKADGWSQRVTFDADAGFDDEDAEDELEDLLGEPAQTKKSTEVALPPTGKATTLREMNERHAVVYLNGKTVVLTENPDGSISLGDRRSLSDYYANVKVIHGTEGKPIGLGDAWFEWEKRREYRSIVFRPDRPTQPGEYNLWRGWIEADPRGESGCPLILRHIREVICNGNAIVARWVLAWCAHMVQKPGEKVGTSLVIKGLKGAGKDTLPLYLGRMMGRGFFSATNSDQVVGTFNALIADRLLVNLEEGVFGGSHKSDSILKALVTSPKALINQKFTPVYEIDSFHRVTITSNSFRPTNVTTDERRWLVLETSESRLGDRAYFNAIYKELDSGGAACLLHYLRNYDISGYDLRFAPRTDAATEQVTETLEGVDAWWRDVIQSETLPNGVEKVTLEGNDWSNTTQVADTEKLREAFIEWQQARRWDAGEAASPVWFGRRLAAFGVRKQRLGGKGRVYVYVIPPLPEAIELFEIAVTGKKPPAVFLGYEDLI
jgi:hypothetical protein